MIISDLPIEIIVDDILKDKYFSVFLKNSKHKKNILKKNLCKSLKEIGLFYISPFKKKIIFKYIVFKIKYSKNLKYLLKTYKS